MASQGERSRRVSLPGVAELLRPAAPAEPLKPRARRAAGSVTTEDHRLPVSAELLDVEQAPADAARYGFADRGGSSGGASGAARIWMQRRGQPDGAPATRRTMTTMVMNGPGADARPGDRPGFEVHLDVFEGPFDLLLALIAKHKLDITEIALSRSPTSSSPTSGPARTRGNWTRRAISWWSPRPCSTSRPPGCCRPARSMTRRTSPCWRPGTCCSPGCCSTARTRRSRPCWRADGRGRVRRFPRRVPMEPRFADLLPEVLLGLGPGSSRRSRPAALAPAQAAGGLRRAPARAATQRPRAGRASVAAGCAAAPGLVPASCPPTATAPTRSSPLPRPARALPRRVRRVRPDGPARRSVRELDSGDRRT